MTADSQKVPAADVEELARTLLSRLRALSLDDAACAEVDAIATEIASKAQMHALNDATVCRTLNSVRALVSSTLGELAQGQPLIEAVDLLCTLHTAHQATLDTLRWLHAEAVWHAEHHRAHADQLGADKNIRQGALNGVLGRPGSADYYEAVEAVADLVNERRRLTVRLEAEGLPQALLRKGVRGLLDQVDAMTRKIREQDAELAEFRAEAEYRASVIDDEPHGACTDPPALCCSDAGCPEHGDRDGDEEELEDEDAPWPPDVVERVVGSETTPMPDYCVNDEVEWNPSGGTWEAGVVTWFISGAASCGIELRDGGQRLTVSRSCLRPAIRAASVSPREEGDGRG